ncbi:MAG: DUF1697 domain-containing protein [bacterium]
MRYVALLRGINVGGNKKVEMKKLKATFEHLGYTDVVTYINSGNVVFDTRNTETKKLRNSIEQLMVKDFGFEVPTIVVSAEALQSIVKEIPSDWTNDDEWKTDVCFLWEEIDDSTTMEKLGYDETIETMVYIPGVVIWHVSRANQLKSKMVKVVGTKLYTQMTVRNVNTVRKLSALLD